MQLVGQHIIVFSFAIKRNFNIAEVSIKTSVDIFIKMQLIKFSLKKFPYFLIHIFEIVRAQSRKIVQKSRNIITYYIFSHLKNYLLTLENCLYLITKYLMTTFFIHLNKFIFFRFLRKFPGMDAITSRSRPPPRNSGFLEFRQISLGSSVPNRFLHARRVSRRGPLQKRNLGG